MTTRSEQDSLGTALEQRLEGAPMRLLLTVDVTALDMDGTAYEAAEVLAGLIEDALDQHEVHSIQAGLHAIVATTRDV